MKESHATQNADLDARSPQLTDEQKRLVAALDSEDFNTTTAVALSWNNSVEFDEKLHTVIGRTMATEQQQAMVAIVSTRPRLIVSLSPGFPSMAGILEHEKRSQDAIAKQMRDERGCRGMRKPQFLHDNAPSLHARYSKKHGRL